jgi:predicted dehydrogenase
MPLATIDLVVTAACAIAILSIARWMSRGRVADRGRRHGRAVGRPRKLGLVGVGKIARDQHLPAIAQEAAFTLIGAASRDAHDRELVRYASQDEMLAALPELEAVSICTPPMGRWALAAEALRAGKHVMIEKPPGATVSEVEALADLAQTCGRTLFASWHSREAAGVAPARKWLSDKRILSAQVTWKEDVRRWHPGQDWIFEAGGLGVFDPAINGLSILTEILPRPVTLENATLAFPSNRDAPIAATLALLHGGEAPIRVDLDFLQAGEQSWDIVVQTDAGELRLTQGGAVLQIGSAPPQHSENREYAELYRRFAALIAAGESDVDLRPLKLVADAFLLGRRVGAPPFSF